MKSYKEIYLIVITFINLNCGILKKAIQKYEMKNNLISKNIEEIEDKFLYDFIEYSLSKNINKIDFEKLNYQTINNKNKLNFENLYKIIFNNKNKLNKDYFINFLYDFYDIKYNDLILKLEENLKNEKNLEKLENFLLKKGKENFELDNLYYDEINILMILEYINKESYSEFINKNIGFINERGIRSNSQTF